MKVVVGQQAEYGGAMVRKLSNIIWPTGTFVETVKGLQKQWFYITEPHDSSRIQVRAPNAAYLLARKGPRLVVVR